MKRVVGLLTILTILFTSSIAFSAPRHPVEKPPQQEEPAEKQDPQNKKKQEQVKPRPAPGQQPKEQVKPRPTPGQQPKEQVKPRPAPGQQPKEQVKPRPAPGQQPKEQVKPRPAPGQRDNMRVYRERERSEWRQRHPSYRPHSIYKEREDVRTRRQWYRQQNDWQWFSSLQFGNVRVYTDHYSDRVIRVQLTSYQHPYYFDTVTRHYGNYHYKKRSHYYDQYGWSYFWIGRTSIIRIFVGDDGYISTVLWSRDEIERHLLTIGYISPESLGYYGQYYDSVPPDVAGEYIEDIVDYLDADM